MYSWTVNPGSPQTCRDRPSDFRYDPLNSEALKVATAGVSDPLAEALAVLDAFMAALNRGDEAGVNATFNFPHVRLASGKVVSWQRRGDYELEGFRARAGEGWAESRWRRDGSLIGRYKSIYIVTLQDGRWGIQARSSYAA